VTIILGRRSTRGEGMRYISSASSNDGTSEITITFQTGYDLDVAAIDVQNRVATAQGRLPATVNATGISITKANSELVLAAGFVSPDHSLSPAFISNYLDVYVADALKRVPGVGAVIIFGERKYAMRIWLDPNELAAARPDTAGRDQCARRAERRVPAGQLGVPPSDPKQSYQMAVRVEGRLTDPLQFENIIIKSTARTRARELRRRQRVGDRAAEGRWPRRVGRESYDTNLR